MRPELVAQPAQYLGAAVWSADARMSRMQRGADKGLAHLRWRHVRQLVRLDDTRSASNGHTDQKARPSDFCGRGLESHVSLTRTGRGPPPVVVLLQIL